MERAYGRFADLYDILMSDVDYDAWTAYLSSLIRLYETPPGSVRVLECACGTGAVSVRMAERGYTVVGSDISEDMLFVAQHKAMERGLRIPFVQQDMRALAVHHLADVIVCCCDGVNYLTDPADVGRFFRSAFEVLRPDGLLLFDISSAYKLEHVLGAQTFFEDTHECAYVWQNMFDSESRLIEMNLSFFVPGDDGRYARFNETHVQHAYSQDEINDLLERNGFVTEGVFDAFSLDTPASDCERLQWVARRRG